MRNTFQVVNIIYKALNVPDVTSAITGQVCKKRPISSNRIDIVIGSLPITGEQIQEGVLNVNIHVPNLTLKLNNVQDNTQPDYAKLEGLTTLVISKLDDQSFSEGDDIYWFYVQQQQLFEGEQNEHYSNIRIKFNSKK